MTQDEIIRMARDADIDAEAEGLTQALERFATLVATHEREACAEVCDRISIGCLMSGIDLGPSECAEQIRARNTP